jgi:hypothetical protein
MSERARVAATLALLLASMLAWHGSFPWLLDYDGFYHLAGARLMLQEGFDAGMPWMWGSIFESGFVDHHFGFHLLLMPFVAWPGGIVGGKLAAGLLSGAALGASFLWLRSERVPAPLFWALLPLAVSWGFAFRIGMLRVMSLSWICLVLAIALASRGRNVGLLLLSTLYSLSYQQALLVLPVAAGAWIADRMLGPDPRHARRPGAWTLAAAAAGLVLGLAIHPHAPRTFGYLSQHLGMHVGGAPLPLGTEWDPPALRKVWMQGTLLVPALLGALVAVGRELWSRRADGKADGGRRIAAATLLVLAGAAAASALSFRMMRFVEVSAPLTAAALGFCARDLGWRLPRWPGLAATAWAALLLAVPVTLHRASHTGDPDPYRFAPAAEFLREHAAPGSLVFNMNWGEWSELVFHAPEFRYVSGLNPGYLARANPRAFDEYQRIAQGWYVNPSLAIRREFDADWVFAGEPPEAVVAAMAQDPGLSLLFRDRSAAVWRVAKEPEEGSPAQANP